MIACLPVMLMSIHKYMPRMCVMRLNAAADTTLSYADDDDSNDVDNDDGGVLNKINGGNDDDSLSMCR
jgi:hypothetical protein